MLVCIPLVALLAHRHCLFHWVASRPLICSLSDRRRPCRCATGSQECNSPLAMGTLGRWDAGTLRRWDAGTLERHDAAYLDTAQPQQTRSQPMFLSAMSPAWPLGVGADSPATSLGIHSPASGLLLECWCAGFFLCVVPRIPCRRGDQHRVWVVIPTLHFWLRACMSQTGWHLVPLPLGACMGHGLGLGQGHWAAMHNSRLADRCARAGAGSPVIGPCARLR